MGRINLLRTIIIALGLVTIIAFFIDSKHTIKQLSTKLSKLEIIRGTVQSAPNPPPSIHRDYVLNFNRSINPPVQCIPIKTTHGKIPICVHDDPTEYITNQIRNSGEWEGDISKIVEDVLVENPDYGYLDIGANLGMFSLIAANLQRPTLAVEAMDINIEKFHQSIFINRFEKYITLVTRPLSDKRETLHFSAHRSNLGHSWLSDSEHSKDTLGHTVYRSVNKTTLMLDELIDLMPRRKAVMVIDVEGNEGKIIRGGQKFFDDIFISHVIMEWNLLDDNDRKFLVDFFSKRGYKVYKLSSFKTPLDWSDYKNWPSNILWKKIDK